MRRSPLVPLLAIVLLLSGCGSATVAPDAPDPTTGGSVSSDGVDGDAVLVGAGMVMQRSPEADVEFCLGAVAESYPPQCGGPVLAGAFSWDDVAAEEQSGVRWTNGYYFGVGHYDKAANTFTLTQPLSTAAPEGFTPPQDPGHDFPQLCDDPFRGGDEGHQDPDLSIQNTFQQRLEELPGYVESWVSDGERMFNVIVTGDAEEAHTALREVWPGGLCVEQRDAPSAGAVQAAADALGEHSEELQLQSWGGQGVLSVSLLIADDENVARIHEIVSPWLTPDQVTISGALQPLRSR